MQSTKRKNHSKASKGRLFQQPAKPDLTVFERVTMHFVLGKVYADCGRIEESANHYRQGNALRRAQFQNPDGWKLDIGPTHQVFTSDLCNSAPTNSAGDITPIFIVGLPRCGSTLLEEVLGAHPDVQVYGEKDYFADSLFEILEHRTGTRSLTNFAALTDTDLQDIRLSYIEKLERHVPARPFIVDKALQNLRHVGAIRFVFPQARIIHSVRDFRDQGLSIFFNYFGEEEKQQYAYDLDDIVERAQTIRRPCSLMVRCSARFCEHIVLRNPGR